MTYQRRRGLPATVYRNKLVTDNRGNQQWEPDLDDPHHVKVWIFPQRSARAEVIGQQQINVIRIGCLPDLEDVGLWSRVDLLGKSWDIAAPPSYHHGSSRHVRHWSIDLRERP